MTLQYDITYISGNGCREIVTVPIRNESMASISTATGLRATPSHAAPYRLLPGVTRAGHPHPARACRITDPTVAGSGDQRGRWQGPPPGPAQDSKAGHKSLADRPALSKPWRDATRHRVHPAPRQLEQTTAARSDPAKHRPALFHECAAPFDEVLRVETGLRQRLGRRQVTFGSLRQLARRCASAPGWSVVHCRRWWRSSCERNPPAPRPAPRGSAGPCPAPRPR